MWGFALPGRFPTSREAYPFHPIFLARVSAQIFVSLFFSRIRFVVGVLPLDRRLA